jgi:hypothetical protein
MRCESAELARRQRIFCLLHVMPVRYKKPGDTPIHGLGGCGIPEMVTHPSTNRGGRCLTSLIGINVVLQAPRLLLNLGSNLSD